MAPHDAATTSIFRRAATAPEQNLRFDCDVFPRWGNKKKKYAKKKTGCMSACRVSQISRSYIFVSGRFARWFYFSWAAPPTRGSFSLARSSLRPRELALPATFYVTVSKISSNWIRMRESQRETGGRCGRVRSGTEIGRIEFTGARGSDTASSFAKKRDISDSLPRFRRLNDPSVLQPLDFLSFLFLFYFIYFAYTLLEILSASSATVDLLWSREFACVRAYREVAEKYEPFLDLRFFRISRSLVYE